MEINNRHGRRLHRSEITRVSPRWSWTLNNPGDWRPDYAAHQAIEYAIHQLERGEEGTPHLQGYVRLNCRRNGASVKTMLGNEGIHLEVSRGNEQQNHDYCSKDETRIGTKETVCEYQPQNFQADAGTQGKRTDFDDCCADIKGGMSLAALASKYPHLMMRYGGNIQRTFALLAPKPKTQRNVTVISLWGPTGTGKTHWVLMHHPDVFMVCAGRDPWNSYSGQEIICFDEFDWEQWPITTMNRALDKWKFELDRRYENRQAEWSRVIICSNSSPLQWYPHASPLLLQAFRRRIQNNVYYLPTRGCQPETEEMLATLKDTTCDDLVFIPPDSAALPTMTPPDLPVVVPASP